MAELSPYYQRGGVTIYCGDCLEAMPRLDILFDSILADLPYGTTACSWDTIIPFEPLWENYKRLVKKNGAVALFGSEPFSSFLRVSNMDRYKYDWVWEKDNAGGPAMSKIQPMRYHENVIIFSKSTHIYNPQMSYAGVKSNKSGRNGRPGMAGKSFSDRNGVDNRNLFRFPKSIIKFDKPKNNNGGGLHPTQKPIALLQYLIRTYTNPNDIILDNTMGSGTTLVAAQNEGRQAVGIEISEEYCKIAVDRLRQPSFFSIPDKAKVPAKQLEIAI